MSGIQLTDEQEKIVTHVNSPLIVLAGPGTGKTFCIIERIKKDLALFEVNIKEIEDGEIKEMATRYYNDAKYYLDTNDYVTSFGCIVYAHGLIDAIRKFDMNK